MKMSKLPNVLAIIAIVTGVVSCIVAIINGTNWLWQLSTAIWAGVALINEMRFDKLTERTKDLVEHYTDSVDNNTRYE